MSDRDSKPVTDFDDLEPLPVEAELAELPEEPVLEELPADAEESTAAGEEAGNPATPAKAKPAAAGGVKPSAGGGARGKREPRQAKPKVNHWERWTGEGEKPKREMEAAPALLRKAAFWLLLGCLLPWGGVTPDWAGNIVEKLLVLAGLYVWHQSHLLRDGVKVPGFISKLGAKNFLGLFILAGILTVVGFAPILSHGSLSMDNAGPFAEKGFMILAGLTMTHIYDYEHGGRFNPMFPLMFLAPGIAGVMGLLKIFSVESIGVGEILGGLGAIAVGGAGWMAAYTMYVALKEAKAHGDAKKLAQLEERKAARQARK